MEGQVPFNDKLQPLDEENGAERNQNLNGSPDTKISDTKTLDLLRFSENFQILDAPGGDDDLETTARKLQRLAEVVEQGNSLALWTGLKLARTREIIPKDQMTASEWMIYERWKKGMFNAASPDSARGVQGDEQTFNLPEFDWDKNRAPVPQGQQSMKKFTQRATAMDIVFGYQGATPEHASWLTLSMPEMLPLIKVVAKINNIERNSRSHGHPHLESLSDMEVAEVQTARKIVATAERNRNRELERIRKLSRSINEYLLIIKNRAESLEK
ncbi:hypothetical protein ARAM_005532 [Aspergillus rambellii]|uniref:Uncharacterized protein n=1 Tax=Aspergillus rambellii TaxID=308745 RepID=A0A0F8XLK5_9EURO|nr:hypothetical protein ARAM_005532 [Aspergillus rambellii]